MRIRKRYREVSRCDLTIIGENGVVLSGGQRARVSLARAVYADADIYLLDDPLSAVDAKVGRHIFEKCIVGILKKRLRVLVTHNTQYLQHADHVILLEKGRVVERRGYNDTIQSKIMAASPSTNTRNIRVRQLRQSPVW